MQQRQAENPRAAACAVSHVLLVVTAPSNLRKGRTGADKSRRAIFCADDWKRSSDHLTSGASFLTVEEQKRHLLRSDTVTRSFSYIAAQGIFSSRE